MKKTGGLSVMTLVAWCLILVSLTQIYPEALFIEQLLLGVVIAFLTLKCGIVIANITGAAGIIIVLVLGGSAMLCTLLIAVILLGTVLGKCFARKSSLPEILTMGTGAFLLAMLTGIACASIVMNTKIINVWVDEVFAQIEYEMPLLMERMQQGEILSTSTDASIYEVLPQFIANLKTYTLMNMPGFIVLMSIANCYLTIIAAKFFMRQSGMKVDYIASFSNLRICRTSIFMLLLACLAISSPVNEFLFIAFANVATVAFALVFMCGLSLVDYFYALKVKNGLLRFIIYFLLGGVVIFAAPVYIVPAITLLGIMDAFCDFRVLKKGQVS